MDTKMTRTTRAELANVIRNRCRSAAGKEKRSIAEVVAATGYHQKSAVRVLNARRRSSTVRGAIAARFMVTPVIELTRPYRKNDQVWIEQKNGAVVRRLSMIQAILDQVSLTNWLGVASICGTGSRPSYNTASRRRPTLCGHEGDSVSYLPQAVEVLGSFAEPTKADAPFVRYFSLKKLPFVG